MHELLIENGYAKEDDVLRELADEFGLEVVDLTQITVEPESIKAVPLRARASSQPDADSPATTARSSSPPATRTMCTRSTSCSRRPASCPAGHRQSPRNQPADSHTLRRRRRHRLGPRARTRKMIRSNCSKTSKPMIRKSPSRRRKRRSSSWSTKSSSRRPTSGPATFTSSRRRTRCASATASTACLQTQTLPPEITRFQNAIISRIKIMARLNIAEKRLPQDGRIKMRVQGREIDVRVSIIPMVYGEGIVMRLLDKGRMIFNLANVGMLPHNYATFKQLIVPFDVDRQKIDLAPRGQVPAQDVAERLDRGLDHPLIFQGSTSCLRAVSSSNVLSAVSLKTKNLAVDAASPTPCSRSTSRRRARRNAAMLPGIASMLMPLQPIS